MSAATTAPRAEDPLRVLMDDTIMVLAAAHRASFDAVLAAAPAQQPVAAASAAAADDDDLDDDDSDAAIDVMKQPAPGGADDDDEEEDEEDPEVADGALQRLRWNSVADGVRAAVASFDAARSRERALVESRIAAGDAAALAALPRRPNHPSVELVASLTGPVCQQRGRYLIWRRAKEADEAAAQAAASNSGGKRSSKKASSPIAGVSNFNVARGDSLGARIDQIMRDATKNLPSTLGPHRRYGVGDVAVDSEDDEEDDDDDGAAVEIYQPPAHCVLNEEDVAQRAAMHHAEDELLQRVQRLQLGHYERYKRWIDVDPLAFGDLVAREKKEQQQTKSSRLSNAASSPDSASNVGIAALRRGGQAGGGSDAAPLRVEEYTIADVALLCAELDIDVEPFRRTPGRVLATLSMEDLRLRMPFSPEEDRACLHAAIQARRGARSSRAASSASGLGGARANVHDVYASARGGAAGGDLAQMLAEATGGSVERDRLRRGLGAADSDPLAALKRRLEAVTAASSPGDRAASTAGGSGRRPLRPSQMSDADYEASAAAADDDDDDGTLPVAPRPQAAAAKKAANTPQQRHADPAAACGNSSERKPAAAAGTTAPPARGGRWAIVEYSDDDKDE